MQAFLPKAALPSLGLHQGFTVSYLNCKVPTKALLSTEGGQITLVKGEIVVKDVSFGHLADLYSLLEVKGESVYYDIQVIGRI